MRTGWGVIAPLAISVCLPMLELAASASETVTVADGEGTWEMTIAPAETASGSSGVLLMAYQEPEAGAVPEPVEPVAPGEEPMPVITPGPSVGPESYWKVYTTIPFIRTEYEANPSYRHEATMEFLFGQLRPTVVHKHVGQRAAAPAAAPFAPPWVYDRYLGQIPTFVQRYFPPSIPFGYPVSW